MTGDDDIRKAASVIVHKMRHGATAPEAMSEASSRMPHLTRRELRDALRWARSAQMAADMMQALAGNVDAAKGVDPAGPAGRMTMRELMDKAGVPRDE